MSYLDDVRRELAAHGIEGSLARRIVAELADHLECDPKAELGAPSLIAARFAEELRVVRTRRATAGSFAALALTAALFAASSLAVPAAGGYPDLTGVRGWIVALAGVTLLVASQVAFAAGVLGAWLLWRRPGELALVQRRMRIAVSAAGVGVAAHLVGSIGMRSGLATWWFVLALAAATVPALALAQSARALSGATRLTPLRVAASGLPGNVLALVAVLAVAAMCAGSAYVEHSWFEGLTRGLLEATAIAACFAAFARPLGLRR